MIIWDFPLHMLMYGIEIIAISDSTTVVNFCIFKEFKKYIFVRDVCEVQICRRRDFSTMLYSSILRISPLG